jgi:hypothetical protein
MRAAALMGLLLAAVSSWAQSKLPLPVTGPAAAQGFEADGPTAAVLTGFLVPSAGPLTSWAAIFRTFEANGGLGDEQTGAWNGPLPSRWIKVAHAGSVVSGLRVLIRTAPGGVQTRQLQVFWQPWNGGAPQGRITEGAVFGQAAGDHDTVRIVELRVPDHAVAVGLYGELFAGKVVQTSLLVRFLETEPTPTPESSHGPTGPSAPSAPALPNSP